MSAPGILGVNQFKTDEDDDDDEDDEDSDYDDDDYADCQSTIKTTAYKSIAFADQKKKGNIVKNSSPSKTFSHGTTTVSLPYIVDVWLINNAQKHVSIQVQLLSGDTCDIETRVSSDQKSLVITFPMTKYMSSSSQAFVPYVLARDQHKKDAKAKEHCKVALGVHPKTYACQKSVSVIKNRDPSNKDVLYEQRIPLPFACKHQFSTMAHDTYFYGENKVHYQDTSVHLQIELIADIGDSYVAEAASLIESLHVNDCHFREVSKIPGNISVSASGKYQHQKGMEVESINSFFPDDATMKTTKSAAASRRSLPCSNKKRMAITVSDLTVR